MKSKMTLEKLAEIIERTVAKKEDIKVLKTEMVSMRSEMATKDDLKELRKEIRSDLNDLETRLMEDTGAVVSVEQKHFRSITQRVARLEKQVFRAL